MDAERERPAGNAETARPALSTRRKLAFAAAVTFATYVVAEIALSIALQRGAIHPLNTWFVFEESGRTIRFDRDRGVFLGPAPSRYARVSFGEVVYDGVARGNAQGFPDRDDFAKAEVPGVRRIAVFGDSFTSAQFLAMNWPDRAEDLLAERGLAVRLLNLSVEGGGLVNWHSILTRVVAPGGFGIDGVIFAVYGNDLRRGFHYLDDEEPPLDAAGQRRHRLGYAFTWDLDALPGDREAAVATMYRAPGYILASTEYDAAIDGTWQPRLTRPFRPALLWQVSRRLGVKWAPLDEDEVPVAEATRHRKDDAGYSRTVERVRTTLRGLGVPVLVVSVPSVDELLGRAPQVPDVRPFAESLGARFEDGAEAFAGLTPDQVRGLFLRHDHHWGQAGSDRFARFIADIVTKWP